MLGPLLDVLRVAMVVFFPRVFLMRMFSGSVFLLCFPCYVLFAGGEGEGRRGQDWTAAVMYYVLVYSWV